MCAPWRLPDGVQFLSYWSKLATYRRLLTSDGLITDNTDPEEGLGREGAAYNR